VVGMYNAGAPAVEGGQIEEIRIPAGDPGEQLVANLILSLVVCQLYALPNARTYIAQAHELAVRLEGQTITYRPKAPSKFARLEFEQQGATEILLLSLINNVLVMPPVGPAELAKFASIAGVTINLASLDVAHFMLRLRTRRLAAALEPLNKIECPEMFTDATHRILTKCFYREIVSEEPLDRADDCYMLARAFIRKGNFQMAAVALKNADSELESYVKSAPLKERHPAIQRMKEQIAAIIKELGSGAA
jgi:hypothetical protein